MFASKNISQQIYIGFSVLIHSVDASRLAGWVAGKTGACGS
jgi:hypothetical protein